VRNFFSLFHLVPPLALLASCQTVGHTPEALLQQVTSDASRFVKGSPVALGGRQILNREDFVYDARFFPDGKKVASSRLGMKSFHLSLHDLTVAPDTKPKDLKPIEVALNPLEFDVENLDISRDGTLVATASKDGALQLFDAQGKQLGRWLTEEPLVSVAISPDGHLIALGGIKGLLTIVSYPQLQFVAEARAHSDEIRALVFSPTGVLFTGGWDKKINVFSLTASASVPTETRVHISQKSGLNLFGAVFNAAAVGASTLDTRLPFTVLKPALAQAAGINVAALTEEVTIATANGNQVVRVARNQKVAVKSLLLEGLDMAVCESCVPQDAQAVLGQNFLARLETAVDSNRRELVLTQRPGAPGVKLSSTQTLALVASQTYPAAVNDLSLDAAGKILGVAFSETKAERNKEVYDREKKNVVEPARPYDCAARVDATTLSILERQYGHLGVVSTVGISPDGLTLASGGWDKSLILHGFPAFKEDSFGWALRRVRFSPSGLKLLAAAWTPQNPLNDHQSDVSLVIYDVVYASGVVETRRQ
jgi:WD40 repeat protein